MGDSSGLTIILLARRIEGVKRVTLAAVGEKHSLALQAWCSAPLAMQARLAPSQQGRLAHEPSLGTHPSSALSERALSSALSEGLSGPLDLLEAQMPDIQNPTPVYWQSLEAVPGPGSRCGSAGKGRLWMHCSVFRHLTSPAQAFKEAAAGNLMRDDEHQTHAHCHSSVPAAILFDALTSLGRCIVWWISQGISEDADSCSSPEVMEVVDLFWWRLLQPAAFPHLVALYICQELHLSPVTRMRRLICFNFCAGRAAQRREAAAMCPRCSACASARWRATWWSRAARWLCWSLPTPQARSCCASTALR